MATLTHDGPPVPRNAFLIGPSTARTHLAEIKRICLCALTILLAGGALAAIIALKTAVYLARFNF